MHKCNPKHACTDLVNLAVDKHDVFLEIISGKPGQIEQLKMKRLRPVLTAEEMASCGLVFVLQQPGQIMVTLPVRSLHPKLVSIEPIEL